MAKVVSVVFSLLITWSVLSFTVAQDCTVLPTLVELTTHLENRLTSEGGQGAVVLSEVGGPYYTCQAQGSSKGIYRELSVIMTYTETVAGVVTTGNVKQFELDCTGGAWASRIGSLSDIAVNLDYANIVPMTACSSCTNTATNDHHCQACDATCNTGLMSCTGATDADCCLAFDDDGSCLATTDSCTKAGFVSTAGNNWECACGQACDPGEAPNAACDGCDVTDICLATSPCMNGAPCTPDVDDPATAYSCACLNSYTGDACSVCSHTCTAGHTFNAACDGCDVTDICLATSPCMNGAPCTPDVDDPATAYSCACLNSYTGDTCSVCGHTCTAGYTFNAACDGCDLTNICEADEPCMNGGVCSLDGAPNLYTCDCTGTNFMGTDCEEERSLTAALQEMSEDPETYKSEYAHTCFNSNNQGKTVVKDEKGKLTILMCPLN